MVSVDWNQLYLCPVVSQTLFHRVSVPVECKIMYIIVVQSSRNKKTEISSILPSCNLLWVHFQKFSYKIFGHLTDIVKEIIFSVEIPFPCAYITDCFIVIIPHEWRETTQSRNCTKYEWMKQQNPHKRPAIVESSQHDIALWWRHLVVQ